MKFNVTSITSLVLVLVAFSSLMSMIALARIDNIVHQDLYRYDLKFSYEWALPYWNMTTLVFVMGWFNIITAIAFQFYMLLYGRRKEDLMPQKQVWKPETTYQPPREEKPIGAEKEKVEEPKPQEIKPAETAEAETRETIATPMEVELEMRKEGEEAAAAGVEAGVGIAMETTMAQTMQPQAHAAPQQLIVCQSCEAQNPVGTKFCGNCGASFAQVAEVKCPKCGAEVPSTKKFCGNCGSPLNLEEINCPECNAKNLSTSKFCGSCGARMYGTPEEYIETEQPEEQREPVAPVESVEFEAEPQEESAEARPTETMETISEESSTPSMEADEEEEPVEATGEVPTAIEEEEMPRETVETETQDFLQPAPEIEAEIVEREEIQTQTSVSTEEPETLTEGDSTARSRVN